jgi:hypothetical protein
MEIGMDEPVRHPPSLCRQNVNSSKGEHIEMKWVKHVESNRKKKTNKI